MAKLRYQIGEYETESLADAKRHWRLHIGEGETILDRLHHAGLVDKPGDPYPPAQDEWHLINTARGALIEKQVNETITEYELTLLDAMQVYVDAYVAAETGRDE